MYSKRLLCAYSALFEMSRFLFLPISSYFFGLFWRARMDSMPYFGSEVRV